MLEELRVENHVIIASAHLQFHAGLNVISGETGVGKSLLFSALTALLGRRLDSDGGENAVSVEGRFRLDPNFLRSLGTDRFEADAEEVVIRVVKKPGGSQRCYLDGGFVARRELAEIGTKLADIQGQRDLQRLLDRAEQVAVLDAYAGCEELRDAFGMLFRRREDARKRLRERESLLAGMRDRLDLLRFQHREITEAEIRSGEHADLEARSRVARTAHEATALLSDASRALSGDDDAVRERLLAQGSRLERLGSDGDAEMTALAERFFALAEAVSDLEHDVAGVGLARGRLDDDPAPLERRLDLLNGLQRKYRCDEAGLVERAEAAANETADLEAQESSLEGLDGEFGEIEAEMRRVGTRLAAKRGRAGRRLAKVIEKELRELGMPKASFRTDAGEDAVGDNDDAVDLAAVTPAGFGDPGFSVQTNPGRDFEPLEAVASGGELSRIMLALQTTLAASHRVPMVLLDEIEAGVGPRLGTVLGRRIRELARHHQVFCITHLPQIAAFADRHLEIRKKTARSKTSVDIRVLDDKERLTEITAMLGGGDDRLARRQAKSLLTAAREGDGA